MIKRNKILLAFIILLLPTSSWAYERVAAKIMRYNRNMTVACAIAREAKKPYILAAVAHVESKSDPTAIGDHGHSFGMFQMQARLHGPIGKTIPEQIKKCESFLLPNIRKYGLRRALQKYNGKGKAAEIYAQKVLSLSSKMRRG